LYPLFLQDLDYPENVYEIKATTSVCKPSTINKFSCDFIPDSPRKTAYVHQERFPNCLIPEKMKEKEFIEDLSSLICPIVSDISIPNNPAISNEGEQSLSVEPLVPKGLVKGKEKEFIEDLSSLICPIVSDISISNNPAISNEREQYVTVEQLVPQVLVKGKEKEFMEGLSSSICPAVTNISIPNDPAISNEGEQSLSVEPLVPQGFVKGKEKEFVEDLSSSSTCPIDFAISKVMELTVDSVNIKEEVETYSPINDSGLEIETKLSVIDTEDEYHDLDEECRLDSSRIKIIQKDKIKKVYKKPARPCFICGKSLSRLKRHIISKHSQHPLVMPILSMDESEKDCYIKTFRKQGIRDFNLDVINKGGNSFMRERKSKNEDRPVMCSGCKGFFSKTYKARHQLICTAAGTNLMMPVVTIARAPELQDYSDDFKSLLNTIRLDKFGDHIKSDQVILMIGSRSHASLKRKKDKVTETKKSVRARMRLISRLYLTFLDLYNNQSAVALEECEGNAADMYRRETVHILAEAINQLCDKPDIADDIDSISNSITNQKSGLKVSIFNMLKLSGKFLIGHFLILNQDEKSKKVVQFLEILKMLQEDLFGDAYYDLNYRKNSFSRKPQNLPKEDDVQLLNDECKKIMNSIDCFDIPSESFINVRSATATFLIIFNARRGGEPVRLKINQWKQALDGYWTDKFDENDTPEMLVTFQTGKGANNLVSVMFPPETYGAMKYLCNENIRKEVGIPQSNSFIFANTQKSSSHTNGWHCINEILKRLSLQGAINATRNRHRVASLLASLQLSDKEKDLIFKHFGHSAAVNENIYQSANGTSQIRNTGKKLVTLASQGTTLESHITPPDATPTLPSDLNLIESSSLPVTSSKLTLPSKMKSKKSSSKSMWIPESTSTPYSKLKVRDLRVSSHEAVLSSSGSGSKENRPKVGKLVFYILVQSITWKLFKLSKLLRSTQIYS